MALSRLNRAINPALNMINNKSSAILAESILDDFTTNTNIAEIRQTVTQLLMAALCTEMEITPTERIKLADGCTILGFLFDDIECYQAESAPKSEFYPIKARN
jgi:hypothetical protein